MKRARTVVLSLIAILWLSTFVEAQSGQVSQNLGANSLGETTFDPNLISYLIQHRRELNLSPERSRSLGSILSAFRKEALRKVADLQLAEIELNELRDKVPADLKAIEEKIRQSDTIKTQLRIDSITADEKARSQLNTTQRQKLEELLKATPLPASQPGVIDPALQQQIQSALEAKYKDQKMVEMETSEAIVTKLLDWAKTFGIVLGVPLTILGIILGWLGIKTVADMKTLAKTGGEDITKSVEAAKKGILDSAEVGKQSIEQKLQEAQQLAETIRVKGDTLLTDYTKLEAQFGNVTALAKEVETLTSKVKRMETFVFKDSVGLTPEMRKLVESSLTAFQPYLSSLGYKSNKEPATIEIDLTLKVDAYYIPERNAIVLAPAMAQDPDPVLRTYAHYAMVSSHPALANISEPGPWNLGRAFGAIESGLADYFPCSFNNKSTIGEKIIPVLQKLYPEETLSRIRNLKNSLKFSEIDAHGTSHDDGELWGGVFWEIRELLKQSKADRLLFSTWIALPAPKPGADSDQSLNVVFLKELLRIYHSTEAGPHAGEIEAIFERRGLKV